MRYLSRALLLLLLVGSVAACNPSHAVWTHFGPVGQNHNARKIVQCESNWNPNAVSPTNDHGLFQINRRWHERDFVRVTGQPWHKVYDPEFNSQYARWLYDRQGWRPWACSRVL
jgi:hypothetical protein